MHGPTTTLGSCTSGRSGLLRPFRTWSGRLASAATLCGGKAAHHHGRALLATGQSGAARAAFQEAISVQPDYVAPRMALASSLPPDSVGLRERARWYREVITLALDHDTARARHAATLRKMDVDSAGPPPMARSSQPNRSPNRPVIGAPEAADRSNADAAPNMDGAF